ncbi:hypothetical protein KY311_03905 [Candidatus Woesearchaeota archaeon]|nr:hypothetical protein [Candidatus Woesearchaeota archaeon]MBW3017384.1 hypothetical protein [Candidatus Woesearchaeota archaeon]
MDKFRFIIALLVVMLSANLVYAADVNTYSAAFNMVGEKAVVKVDVLFNQKTTEQLKFDIPSDYEGLSVYVNDDPVKADVDNNVLTVDVIQKDKVSFSYATSEFVDKQNFILNLKMDFDADNVMVALVLPEGATLEKPIKEGDLTTGSIYPKPDESTTDGRSLMFGWLWENVNKGDEYSIFAQVRPEPEFPLWLILVISAAAVAAVILVIFARKAETKVIVEKQDMVEKHLKTDEEQIVNVLKLKGGSTEQGTLRVATGFAKATLSRILKELEERNVIYKEKRGKKNLIFLKK